jgi:hypothetical protein
MVSLPSEGKVEGARGSWATVPSRRGAEGRGGARRPVSRPRCAMSMHMRACAATADCCGGPCAVCRYLPADAAARCLLQAVGLRLVVPEKPLTTPPSSAAAALAAATAASAPPSAKASPRTSVKPAAGGRATQQSGGGKANTTATAPETPAAVAAPAVAPPPDSWHGGQQVGGPSSAVQGRSSLSFAATGPVTAASATG